MVKTQKLIFFVFMFVAMIAGITLYLSASGSLLSFMDSAELSQRIQQIGLWGPFAVIILLAVAIIFSPIPSAPIALAAGAAYGHLWGTIIVLIGAELGAVTAFGIARFLGYDHMKRWFGDRLNVGFWSSQAWLMGIVMVSRLLPFISFDLVSYAAGLTPLKFWRFAIATFAGILPSSFILAHFGGELLSTDPQHTAIAIAVISILGILTFGMQKWPRRFAAGELTKGDGNSCKIEVRIKKEMIVALYSPDWRLVYTLKMMNYNCFWRDKCYHSIFLHVSQRFYYGRGV